MHCAKWRQKWQNSGCQPLNGIAVLHCTHIHRVCSAKPILYKWLMPFKSQNRLFFPYLFSSPLFTLSIASASAIRTHLSAHQFNSLQNYVEIDKTCNKHPNGIADSRQPLLVTAQCSAASNIKLKKFFAFPFPRNVFSYLCCCKW